MEIALSPPFHGRPGRPHRRVQYSTAPPALHVAGERPPVAVEVVTVVEARTQRSDEISPRVLAEARRGDHKAFVAIMRHYDRRLRMIAYRILRDRDLMDDALQDVAIKAFRALPAFRGGSTVGTWLYRITYTTCLDYVRRTKPVELYPTDELPERPDPGPDMVETIGERDLLERKLARLTTEQRIAVLLVDQEGFDYQAAADILGVPAGTIASRLSVARAALRRALDYERGKLQA
jgi:RNA polymerase sigma-70 factor, ECF subfamily